MDYRISKKLLPDEVRQYESIGIPDTSQNWLELFTQNVVEDLFTAIHSCSDNTKKAEYIKKEMEYYGFYEVGEGTNVYTMANPAYPGVVFKFALDDCGLADNFNDPLLEEIVNELLGKPRYTHTFARHPSGIVSVQERKVVVRDQERMDEFRGSIIKALWKLSSNLLIVDLSPDHYHLNYGIDRNGEWCFVDASDLYPLVNIKGSIRCNKALGWNDKKHEVRRCKGRLKYNYDFSAVVCEDCGMEYMPLELRPKDKEDLSKMLQGMMDGYTAEERAEMTDAEMQAVLEKHTKKPAAPMYNRQTSTGGVPSKANPDNIQIGDEPRPKAPPINPAYEEAIPKEDEDLQVEQSHVNEPSDEDAKKFSTVFVPPEDEDDGDDESDEDSVETTYDAGRNRVSPPPEEDETPNPTAIESKLTYEVVNADEETSDNRAAITITIDGDFDAAYEEYGLPIFVRFADKNYSAMAISSATIKKMLDAAMPDILDDVK